MAPYILRRRENVRTYRVHWLSGKIEEFRGQDIQDAFRRAGYRHNPMNDIDYYEEI